MSYRFKLDEPIEDGFHRITRDQIERAIGHLVSDDDAPTEIHSARKCMKRIRALLRLARCGTGEAAFRRENARFRDIGRLLSASRDKAILLETVTKLQGAAGKRPAPALAKLKASLAEAAVAPDRTAEERAHRADAAKQLSAALKALDGLRFEDGGFQVLARGLEKSYRRTREAFADAFALPGDEAFHELRKGIQAHWRHMSLLDRAWPALASARHDAARDLSVILGDDHDLAILAHHLAADEALELSTRDRKQVLKLATGRQAELRRLVEPLAARLLAERPVALARRFETYWDAAQRAKALAKVEPDA